MTTSLSHYTIKSISKKDIDEKNSFNIPVISDTIKIIDSRQLKDFKDQTFGGYKISQAGIALEKAILEDKIEPALHWTLQLFLSGILTPLWNKFINIACKSINIYNNKLPEFLHNKTKQWDTIIDCGKFTKDNILLLRNHPGIRLLLAEMVCVLCLSRKRKSNTLPRIKKEEFIIDNFKSKLEAKDNQYSEIICIDGDPSEIRIAINEMANHINNCKSTKALYWLNWIIEWEKINSKRYGKYECGMRVIEGVDGKYFKDVVWLIWATINKVCQNKFRNIVSNLGIGEQVAYLYKMYINKFNPGARSKKQNLIIWAILYMTETIDNTVALVDRPQILFQSMLGFDKIVMSLKSQEVHHVVNNDLVNVVVENNYMKPATYKELEAKQLALKKEKEMQEKELIAKQKNINVHSMVKLNDMFKLDRMMYA